MDRKCSEKPRRRSNLHFWRVWRYAPLIDFYKNLDEIEEDLSDFPELGRIEPLLQDRSKSYRSLVATKYNKIIYYVDDDKIYIVDFWDARREPKAQASRLK